MINIRVNAKNLEYDIHALFKSYFPEEEISIKYAELSEESIGVPSFYDIRLTDKEASCVYFPPNTYSDTYDINASDMGNEAETENTEGLDRSIAKNALKRCIYRTLKKQTGRELPWGTLTGIRPTKIPMKREEYTSLVSRASPIAITGGSRAQGVA